MLDHSVFIADCICGHRIESPTRECICPTCQRQIVFEWGQDSKCDGTGEDAASSEAA